MCYFRSISGEVNMHEKCTEESRVNVTCFGFFFFFVGFQRTIYLLWGKPLVSEGYGFQKQVAAQHF